ncbi:putative multidrug resistance protein fnx1 [Xylaria digitata]|nr:putative multidrug resistance protein fnx1 [Xylaria digitata]
MDEHTVEPSKDESDDVTDLDNAFEYITGWRLHFITTGLGLCLFLVNFEITIVSTALVSITNDLRDFSRNGWVINAYLLTYTGGLVVWSKLSDIFGRKGTCLASLFVFTAFSGACGGAQTLVQLIVFRAFQGIGASGLYALTTVIFYELVPPNKYPAYTSLIMVLFSTSLVLGPIFGGLISQQSTWRWVFLLNVPAGVAAWVVLFVTLPKEFPYQGSGSHPKQHRSFRTIDFLGAFLMVAAIALLITGLEEAASLLSWTSPTTLGPLAASAVVWVAFFTSQWYSSRPFSTTEPMFPWRFLQSRTITALLLNSFTTGAVSITCMIQLPIRYQAAAALSPLQAGIRLIPFSVASPIGVIIVAILAKNRRVPPIYLALAGEIIQILGLVFISRSPLDNLDWDGLYGLEVLIGLGMGFCIGTGTLLTPFIMEKRDLAVGTGTVVQYRFLGSTVVISIVTAVGNNWIKEMLLDKLTSLQLTSVFRSTEYIGFLPDNLEHTVRRTFAAAFNLQMEILIGFAVAAIFSSLLMWQKTQIRVP